jgi:glutamate synthase domain-containing protein 2
LGADAVSIGTASLVALGCNREAYVEDYQALGTMPGYCHHCHTGRCPVGITTQLPELEARLDPELGARHVRNYISTMVLELQTLARACGKSHVLNLEPEDLAALTVEAAAMARVPLAGTNWIPGVQSR